MKKLSFAIYAGALAWLTGAPAAAQMTGPPSTEFVHAIKDRDADKALGIAGENPSPAILNARDGDGNTGLIIAVARRDPEWTGFLLNKGADPNLGGKGGEQHPDRFTQQCTGNAEPTPQGTARHRAE